jgi:hypothetical protein
VPAPGSSSALHANARDMFDHARPDLDQALADSHVKRNAPKSS